MRLNIRTIMQISDILYERHALCAKAGIQSISRQLEGEREGLEELAGDLAHALVVGQRQLFVAWERVLVKELIGSEQPLVWRMRTGILDSGQLRPGVYLLSHVHDATRSLGASLFQPRK